jgi:ketosteroid isomerase-like protein
MIGLLIAAAAAGWQPAPAAAPRRAPPRTNAVVAQISKLEHDWGQAFVKRDFAFIERIVAPEYRLAGASADGKISLTLRDEWMRNARAFETQAFAIENAEVMTAGDTAVAVVKGNWMVKRSPGRPAQLHHFVVTDTWVRRGGQWQVVHRYSHRLPQAAAPPAAR